MDRYGKTGGGLILMGIGGIGQILMPGVTTLAMLAGGALITGIELALLHENRFETLFRKCGIKSCDDKIPLVIKHDKDTLVIHMPEGISQKHFEQRQQEIEQALNCKVEYGFNKNLVMKLTQMNLGANYKYEFEDCEDPTEVFIGYTHEGKFYFDIDDAIQTIVAGEPKSGKSSFLRTIILSLILSRHNIDLHLIDFQGVELGIFQDCKKVRSYGEKPEDFGQLLDEMEQESDRRLKLFTSVRKKRFVQNLAVWNKFYPSKALPYKVIIIDEFSRISDSEGLLDKFRVRVALDRKVGLLYLVSMQRPDIKIISGSTKGCMPTRLAFKVVTDVDSEVILNVAGAEQIKNKGRCLIKYNGEIKEVQCLYIEPDDVRSILIKHNAFKTTEEIQSEKRAKMKVLRGKCINPYLKKVMK